MTASSWLESVYDSGRCGSELHRLLGRIRMVAARFRFDRRLDDPSVYAMTVYDGNLVAAGYFLVAGDSLANSIAMWDGSAWSALTSGAFMMEARIHALIVFDNKLTVGTDVFGFGTGLPGRNWSLDVKPADGQCTD